MEATNMTETARPRELAKSYDPQSVEARWYEWWDSHGYFTPEIDHEREPFVIVMPPPNVTGELHMGHAMFVAVEDILTRRKRMQGYPTLWLPGADHAGIAGQWVVEKELAEEGVTRHDLGREKFLERVWEWMDRYRGRIREQLRILGASCDWSRFHFTMDPGPSRAVRTAFKQLYDKGLIYRGERMINWCPRCQTALSDLEVDHEDHEGTIWRFRYPIDGSDEFVEVATTRPETMLGDTAIAVHPDDARYKHLIGKTATLPIVGRTLQIVADEHVDPEFGSGAVKVTPNHDPNDFEIAQRNGLPGVNIMNLDGTLNQNAGPFDGMTIAAARKDVLDRLEQDGYLVGQETHTHSIGHCQRCATVVEPLISEQWFVRMEPLARPAIQVAKDGSVRFVPERFTSTYLHWMENIHDWCISRQLWWGHRIPVWYCRDCARETATDQETLDACEHCGSQDMYQDPDVLDTWFSSGLWTFSTLGWPDETEDLDYFYPGSVMETGYDIIFFWVARMIFFGIEFQGEPPFHTVYFHGTVRDENGQRMSKTKGNVIDPTEVTENFGSDALRFALITAGAPGADLKLSLQRVESNRNFANKIWNATRYVLRSIEGHQIEHDGPGIKRPDSSLTLPDRWILSRLEEVTAEADDMMERFQLGEAAKRLYDFIWSEYCDWYIEASKVALNEGTPEEAATARQTLVYTLERSLRLLHPYMPFLTEELWQQLPVTGESVMIADWPGASPERVDQDAIKEFRFLMDAVRAVRNARAESNVEPKLWIAAIIFPGSHASTLKDAEGVFRFLARIDADLMQYADNRDEPEEQSISLVVDDAVIYLPMAGMVDIEAERERLAREISDVEDEIKRASDLLGNGNFVQRAPEDVVNKHRERLADAQERLSLLQERLSGLGE
jgi:valyl-tRNA synthetase